MMVLSLPRIFNDAPVAHLTPPSCCSEPISYAAVEEDGTCGLVIEFFDDLDKVCVDVVLLHGCPKKLHAKPY